MLDPRDRQLLLESLRPPQGYRLSGAIGTSYTLDLIALLTAPLAFTLHDWEDEDGGTIDSPLALLESVRRHAANITLFCQAGEIKVPPPTQRLVAYLEPCIAEVKAPHSAGVFHPKVWLLRYACADRPVRYRFLCLSRNLTFDKCWDTILSLDGEIVERTSAIAANHPLGEFVEALATMTIRPLIDSRKALIVRMAEEVRRVRFELPEGVDEIAFWPMGFDRRRRWPFPASQRPVLVMSPFVSESLLMELSKDRADCVLVSRPDQLAQLQEQALAPFAKRVYTMDPTAEDLDAVESSEGSAELAGLHAKLFVIDDGWNARVYTGSANATDAAFKRNVEFLVEMRGKKSCLGIDAFLQDSSGDHGFGRLLIPWQGSAQEISEQERIRKALEQKLGERRRELASRGLAIRCTAVDDRRFTLELHSEGPCHLDSSVELKCWPTSLRSEEGRALGADSGLLVSFGPLTLDAITGFFAFELRATEGGIALTSRFVLSLPLVGAPTDRLERLLASQLKDQEHVLRFIWLLLESEMSGGDAAKLAAPMFDEPGSRRGAVEGYPVFERLVSSLGHSVDRARDVGRVIEDLMRSPEGRAVLPEGLTELWEQLKGAIENPDEQSA